MARIRQYQSTIDAPQPSGVGAESLASQGESKARAGAARGAMYRSIGSDVGGGLGVLGAGLTERQTQDEQTKAAAALSKFQAEQTLAWQDALAKADPGDNETPTKFLDTFSTSLDQLGEGLNLQTRGAQQAWQRAAADMRANFMVKAHSGYSELAGVDALQKAIAVGNNTTSAIKADPNNYQSSLDLMNFYLQGSGVDPETKLKLRTQWGKDASLARLYSIAQHNPPAALAELEGGKHDMHLDAQDKEQAAGHIRELANILKTEKREEDADVRRKHEEDFAQQSDAIFQKQPILKDGTRGAYPGMMRDIQNLPVMTPEDGARKRAMANDLESTIAVQNKEKAEPQDDKATVSDFWKRAYLPEGDNRKLSETEIFQAKGDGLIKGATRDDLVQAIHGEHSTARKTNGKDFEDWLPSTKSYVTKSSEFGPPDSSGNQRWGEFQAQARLLYREGIDSGRSLEDIKAAIMRQLPRYQRSTEQVLNSMNTDLSHIVAPLPTPSIAHFGTGQGPFANNPSFRQQTFPDNMTIKGQPQPQQSGGLPKGMIEPMTQNPFDQASYPDGVQAVISFNDTVIPTKIGGQQLTMPEAIQRFQQTGEHFGKFGTVADANAFVKQLTQMLDVHPEKDIKRKSGETIQQWKQRTGR